MPNSSQTTPDPHSSSFERTRPNPIQAKLEDTIELLHLWCNEAHAYRHLIEARQVDTRMSRRSKPSPKLIV